MEKAKLNISIFHMCLLPLAKSPDMTKKGLDLSFLYLLFKQICSEFPFPGKKKPSSFHLYLTASALQMLDHGDSP